MTSIGETLRRERLRRNLDLEQISRELKISSRMLAAIEDERFDRLPGGVFIKSFVRQYAHILGLDEEELATEVQRMLDPPPDPVQPNGGPFGRPAPSIIHVPKMDEWESVGDRGAKWGSWLRALAGVVAVMLVCSGVYAWWQHSRHPLLARGAAPPAAETPTTTVPDLQPAAPPSGTPAPPQNAAGSNTPGATPPATTPATPVNPPQGATPAPHAETVSRDVPPPAAPTTQNPPPPATPATNAPVRLQMTAEEPVWVMARADGKLAFSGTLAPNESRTIEANGTILLRLGNAGGINVVLNGKPVGSLGPKGQVREVQFTSGGFQIVAAPKPLADPL